MCYNNSYKAEFNFVIMEEEKKRREEKEFKTRIRETKILEAICDKGCRDVKSISGVTEISYNRVENIINNANLLVELKRMKENDIYEKIKSFYKGGMTNKEIGEKLGLYTAKILAPLKRFKKELEELSNEQKNLSYTLNQIILKRAKEEDVPFYYAYLYSKKPHLKLDFDEIYRRTKDIYKGLSSSECIKRWGLTRQRFWQFIDAVGMRDMYLEQIPK